MDELKRAQRQGEADASEPELTEAAALRALAQLRRARLLVQEAGMDLRAEHFVALAQLIALNEGALRTQRTQE